MILRARKIECIVCWPSTRCNLDRYLMTILTSTLIPSWTCSSRTTRKTLQSPLCYASLEFLRWIATVSTGGRLGTRTPTAFCYHQIKWRSVRHYSFSAPCSITRALPISTEWLLTTNLFSSCDVLSASVSSSSSAMGNYISAKPLTAVTWNFAIFRPSFIREPNDSRQFNLKAHFHFECSCEACMENYPIAFNQSLRRELLTIRDDLILSTEVWREEFARNCKIIQENQGKFSTHALCKIMDRNLYLLAAIAKNEPFVF